MAERRNAKRDEAGAAGLPAANGLSDDRLRQEIELRAYHRYCERGCAPGHEVEDWLAAEEEVQANLRAANAASPC